MPETSPEMTMMSKRDSGPGSDGARSLVGQKAGSFKLLRELGRGGMGVVYQGEHDLISSRVAVKVLHGHLAANNDIVERFFAEARAVNLIGHENIVRIFDMNRLDSGEWFLVMEYLQGQSLSEFAQKPLAERTTSQLLVQVLDALDAAHGRGIIHRDVKPENVFVQPRADGTLTVKLLDFGIARFFGETRAHRRTSAGMILGTPAFMSPEQWEGGPVDERTDVYACGVLGWLLATGKNPFEGLPLADLILAQRQGPKAPAKGQMSDGYLALLRRALAPEREQRFASAAAMRDALVALSREKAASPMQVHTRDLVRYPISINDGGTVRALECIDLSKAGAYVCTDDDKLPKLRAAVTVVMTLPGGELAARAEVVRVVPKDLGQAWKLPSGFALQFLEPTRTFGEKLDRMLRERLAAVSNPTPVASKEDPAAAQRLRELACRLSSNDPYQLLDVATDAGFPEVRRKSRMFSEELQSISRAFLASDSKDRLKRLTERAQTAVWTLADPVRRADYDARRGNYRGVARCIAAGLSTAQLEKIRSAYLQDFPRHSSRAQIYRITADLHASRGETEAAIQEYERALMLDPLNVEVQRSFWALQRRMTLGQQTG